MLQPIHTPLGRGDRIAGLLDHLARHPGLMLTPLGIRRGSEAVPMVIARLADRGREALSADEARTLAVCLRAGDRGDGPTKQDLVWAADLDNAAADAERQASAIVLAAGGGRRASAARAFGVVR